MIFMIFERDICVGRKDFSNCDNYTDYIFCCDNSASLVIKTFISASKIQISIQYKITYLHFLYANPQAPKTYHQLDLSLSYSASFCEKSTLLIK